MGLYCNGHCDLLLSSLEQYLEWGGTAAHADCSGVSCVSVSMMAAKAASRWRYPCSGIHRTLMHR